MHFPNHDPQAVEVFGKALKALRPSVSICLGDLVDCAAFSTHAPDPSGDVPYDREISLANAFLDDVQKASGKTVYLEGNHEYRLERYAARDRAGKAAKALLSPRELLGRGRKNFTFVPYSHEAGEYGHYRAAPNLVCVHGWSHAQNATRQHLEKGQGVSVIHGHTHRADHQYVQGRWSSGIVEAVSAGCLCKRIPTYMAGTPVDWVHGFIMGYLGKTQHTLFFVPIVKNACVLPSGREIRI